MFDMNAIAAKVKAKRDATGLGLNVRFLRDDGTPDEFSFAEPARAIRFREALIQQGRTVLN